jgi:hypothetical protein
MEMEVSLGMADKCDACCLGGYAVGEPRGLWLMIRWPRDLVVPPAPTPQPSGTLEPLA